MAERSIFTSSKDRLTVLSPLRYIIWYSKNQTKKPIISIEIVILGQQDRGVFISVIKLNANFTPGINTTRIFNVLQVHYNKDNGKNTGNIIIPSLWDRLKHIFDGRFLSCKYENKIKFWVLLHNCTIPPPQVKNEIQSVHIFLSLDTYIYTTLYLERIVDSQIGNFRAYWTQMNGLTKSNKWYLSRILKIWRRCKKASVLTCVNLNRKYGLGKWNCEQCTNKELCSPSSSSPNRY